MYFTPESLKSVQLKKAIIDGYSKQQVKDILCKVSCDYMQLLQENSSLNEEVAELKNRITVLTQSLDHYKMLEESLQHSIIVTQHASEQIKANACDKAKNIIEEAEVHARKIIEDANFEVAKSRNVFEEVKSEINSFRAKAESLLMAQLEILKQLG